MNYSLQELLKSYQAGKKNKFLFFWGHRPNKNGEITASCFSQWSQDSFEVDGQDYPTAEHWMMVEKARLFNDKEIESKILNAKSPGEAKKLGRLVKGFDQKVWETNRSRIVIEGNFHKFDQNPALKAFLLSTKQRILVEASPVDPIWGIGLAADHEFAAVPTKWKGLNLLGFALMEVRDRLANT